MLDVPDPAAFIKRLNEAVSNEAAAPKPQMPHVMICTPCKDGKVDLHYSSSLVPTCQILTHAGIKYQMSFVSTSSIDNARSILATMFLKSPCTHLLFIDDDMCWAPDLPLRMLNENVDIVGVPYRKKKNAPEFTVKHAEVLPSLEGRPWMILFEALGMGMTLIHRRVFEGLEKDVPLYHPYATSLNDPARLFFRHDLITDKDGSVHYESEDFHFCRMAREKGFEIFAYADENVPHIGRTAFQGVYSDVIGAGIAHGFRGTQDKLKANLLDVESK